MKKPGATVAELNAALLYTTKTLKVGQSEFAPKLVGAVEEFCADSVSPGAGGTRKAHVAPGPISKAPDTAPPTKFNELKKF